MGFIESTHTHARPKRSGEAKMNGSEKQIKWAQEILAELTPIMDEKEAEFAAKPNLAKRLGAIRFFKETFDFDSAALIIEYRQEIEKIARRGAASVAFQLAAISGLSSSEIDKIAEKHGI
tara:strand:+ start:797 stop:1156 length:360 start_codon:yes stop_codon:yes gene_type:complete